MSSAAEKAGVASLALLGISATGGGLMLVLDPSGESIGFPPGLLDSTPFIDYFIPGLLLLIILGLGSIAAVLFWILRPAIRGYLLLFEGCVLVVWMSVQICGIGLLDPLQPIMFLLGLTMCGLGWKLRTRQNNIY